jgi:hypothetical protein
LVGKGFLRLFKGNQERCYKEIYTFNLQLHSVAANTYYVTAVIYRRKLVTALAQEHLMKTT